MEHDADPERPLGHWTGRRHLHRVRERCERLFEQCIRYDQRTRVGPQCDHRFSRERELSRPSDRISCGISDRRHLTLCVRLGYHTSPNQCNRHGARSWELHMHHHRCSGMHHLGNGECQRSGRTVEPQCADHHSGSMPWRFKRCGHCGGIRRHWQPQLCLEYRASAYRSHLGPGRRR